jgi:hypothetical protein
MKNLFIPFALVLSIFFTACEGPQGPPGEDGINILGQVFEVTTNFSYNPNTGLQETLINIPNDIEVFESDVILVYRLEKVVNDGNGGSADAWAPLPQNFFFNNGDIIQYVFNHTFFDVEILIDGNFNLATLETDFTTNQTFRIAVVPAEFASANYSMEELLEVIQIHADEIISLNN